MCIETVSSLLFIVFTTAFIYVIREQLTFLKEGMRFAHFLNMYILVDFNVCIRNIARNEGVSLKSLYQDISRETYKSKLVSYEWKLRTGIKHK